MLLRLASFKLPNITLDKLVGSLTPLANLLMKSLSTCMPNSPKCHQDLDEICMRCTSIKEKINRFASGSLFCIMTSTRPSSSTISLMHSCWSSWALSCLFCFTTWFFFFFYNVGFVMYYLPRSNNGLEHRFSRRKRQIANMAQLRYVLYARPFKC